MTTIQARQMQLTKMRIRKTKKDNASVYIDISIKLFERDKTQFLRSRNTALQL